MLRLARPSACGGSSDLSFAEPIAQKRKADCSCLMELGEGKKKKTQHKSNSLSDQGLSAFLVFLNR